MSKPAVGNISGVPWSTTPETNYDVIVEEVDRTNNSNQTELTDESDEFVLAVASQKKSEIRLNAAIKGPNNFGKNALVGALITDLVDTDLPSPLWVTSNGFSKRKGQFATCQLTATYYADDFTTGTLGTTFSTTTTTTTTTAP